MKILSLNKFLELKELIKPYGYGIHIHDGCGGQSFTLEILTDNYDNSVYEVISKFFINEYMTPQYLDDKKLDFIVN